MKNRSLPSGWRDWSWTARVTAFAVLAFIAFHVALDVYGRGFADWYVLSPWTIAAHRWWTVVTTAFAPQRTGDAAITIGAFWLLGRTAERDLRTRKFLVLIVLATVVAHLVFLAVCAIQGTQDSARGLGAAAMAVAVFVAVKEPHEVLVVLGFSVRVRIVAGVYVAVAVASSFGWIERVDARWVVEATGAAIGAVAARFDVVPDIAAVRNPLAGMLRPTSPTSLSEREIRDRVDALLEKVGSRGMASLTQKERDFLNEASKRYR